MIDDIQYDNSELLCSFTFITSIILYSTRKRRAAIAPTSMTCSSQRAALAGLLIATVSCSKLLAQFCRIQGASLGVAVVLCSSCPFRITASSVLVPRNQSGHVFLRAEVWQHQSRWAKRWCRESGCFQRGLWLEVSRLQPASFCVIGRFFFSAMVARGAKPTNPGQNAWWRDCAIRGLQRIRS